MMMALSFKTTSNHLLLCVFLSLLWDVSDSTTPTPDTTLPTSTGEPRQSTPLSTKHTTTILTTAKAPPSNAHTTLPTSTGEPRESTPLSTEPTTTIPTTTKAPPSNAHTTLPTSTGEPRESTPLSTEPTTTVPTTTKAPPSNAGGFKAVTQNETSITLEWTKAGNILNYILKFSDKEETVTASEGQNPVSHTVSRLTSATTYTFTLLTVFDNISSTGVNLTASTAPSNTQEFKAVTQNETSITLQWTKAGNILNYILKFNDKEETVTASEGQNPVNHTVSGLTSATTYTFTLLTVFNNISSTGVNLTASTAPSNAGGFKAVTQNETSITLEWTKAGNILNYILKFNDKEETVTASEGQNPVRHTVSRLTSATTYTFTLLTVFDNISSTGVNLTASTAPRNAEGFQRVAQDETSITLEWTKVDNISNYILKFNDKEETVNASEGRNPVRHIISQLTSATTYTFTLLTVFNNIRSTGVNLTASTAPRDAQEFQHVAQNETSITLEWTKVGNTDHFILKFSDKEETVTASEGQNPVSHTVSGLTNTTTYTFTLLTVFNNISSTGVNLTASTAPRDAQGFQRVAQNETSITLEWTKVDDIPNYILKFNDKEETVPASEGQNPVRHIISGLTNTTTYTFTLLTVFQGVNSTGVRLNASTAPRNAQGFQRVAQNETSITLQWTKVDDIPNYILKFDNKEETATASEGQNVTRIILALQSGIKYTFTLLTVFDNISSTGISLTAATVPPKVSSVSVLERSTTSINLTWDNVNGNWEYMLHIDGNTISVAAAANHQPHSVKIDLEPGTVYSFSLITTFSGLNSTEYKDFTVTKIDCTTVDWHVTNSSIQGMVEGNFSKATASNEKTYVSPNGTNVSFTGLTPGTTYEVLLVYEKDNRVFNQCQHNLTIIPADVDATCKYSNGGYAINVVWEKLEGVWTEVEVNVTRKTHRVFPNGTEQIKISGFQPAKTYEVSVGSLREDSGTVRRSPPYVFECYTDPTGVIAGSVLAVLLFVVLVCLATFILLKKPDFIRKKTFIGGSKQSDKTSKAISVAKFPDHFRQLSVDDNRGFIQEYENLASVGTEQMRKAAVLPENKARNRFNNVLPYDWCRVKLSTSNPNETSDYINASYMPGYNRQREYIATQGPLPSTVCDFWRMIWEQRVKGIVMVTNCVEGGRTKCERYWPPDSNPCPHGKLLITMKSEQQEPNWTLREFSVKNTSTSEERTVKHFHFTAWPDHGVPEGTDVLIQFRELVRWHIDKEGDGAPTVVHCSAGVGRTGTIIALDVLLQQFDKKRAVGINGFVHKMRLSRPYMVQTESQYVFLHQCIMDHLKPQEKLEENIYENADIIYANATALQEFRLHKTNA